MGDELSLVLEMLPLEDLPNARATCRPWSGDIASQRSLFLGRLTDLLVARIKKTHHVVPPGSSLGNIGNIRRDGYDLPSTIVDENMPAWMFDLLFGRDGFITKPDNSMELTFTTPADAL